MKVPVWSEAIGASSGWNASSGYGPLFYSHDATTNPLGI